jgi:hypothetical protein
VNILFIRLFLIAAAVFFIVFACVVGKVFVDSIVFNSIFIIINGTYSVFLILKHIKVHLTPLEERIFEKDFKKVMDRRTFRNFIRKAHLRTFSEDAQIVHNKNTFTGLYYIALLNPNFMVQYIKEGKSYFNVGENTWIGVVEYTMYEKVKKENAEKLALKKKEDDEIVQKKKKKKNTHKEHTFYTRYAKIKWGLDAIVKEKTHLNAEGVMVAKTMNEILPTRKENVNDSFYQEEDEPCYVYEFPLNVF